MAGYFNCFMLQMQIHTGMHTYM